MPNREIIQFCMEKGLLLDQEVLGLFSEMKDIKSVKVILEKIKNFIPQRVITKSVFDDNKDQVNRLFYSLPEENQKGLENLKIKLGLSIEISREKENFSENFEKTSIKELTTVREDKNRRVKIITNHPLRNKKLEVKDFVNYFRGRLKILSLILQEHSELKGLISIGKISGKNQKMSIIGIISDKKITKNKNILLEIEDLTGKMKVLVNQNKPELYTLAENLTLDSVVGFSGSGGREILFANNLIFPDAILKERKKSPIEEYALFTGDLHIGSKLFLEDNFLKFIDYLNGEIPNTPEVEKIKYLFIVGDLISGVGIYPGQENELEILDVESQYTRVAELLEKIRKDITIIICPGNHDSVRIMEPQPLLDERYAWRIYELENVIMVGNPSLVNIGNREEIGFPGFDVLLYHGYSYHYYGNNIPKFVSEKIMKHSSDKVMHYLLKCRHLAPTHSSTLYFPSEEDPLLIKKVPDIFLSGHNHRSAISHYNNILTLSSSCWEGKTAFQEKMGNDPDFCKVPMLNLKTRAIRVLDFE